MSDLTIVTNNHARDLVCLCDLPAKAQADFDYIKEEEVYSPRLFSYRGAWYDTNEFTRWENPSSPLNGGKWDGFQSETYFSGVLVRYANDYESVIVAHYYC